jgi:DNA invertase Pin-like site-specific DNA recombinase
MAKVKIIPPTIMQNKILRVAAYCRVSSDSDDQLHSYAAQIRSYTAKIEAHDGWEFVDIYADEGLTGTRMDKREDFNRLLRDCRKGKIDKILVKSISRFARNIRDCLVALRELMALGVTVEFEEDNIQTETLSTELLVSVSGALAQQESISISQNLRISYQRRMQRGEFITCSAPYGYRLKDKKFLEIVPEEAEVVRWIFQQYVQGKSIRYIVKMLNNNGITLNIGQIKYMIANEKYIGDSLCQKTYTSETIPFIEKDNHGEKEQYYIRNTHPAIITHEIFAQAKKLRERRAKREMQDEKVYPLTRKMVCGSCGTPFCRRHTRSGYVAWVCRKHNDNASECPIGRIPETEIYAAFIRMYHKLRQHQDVILTPMFQQLDELNKALQRNNSAMLEINKTIAEAAEQNHKINQLQRMGLLDMDACIPSVEKKDAGPQLL